MPYRPGFRINERADREQASDGVSRYGAYLAQHRPVLYPFGVEDAPTDEAVEFAVSAWQVAGPPIMAPGYVSWHRRIQNTSAQWDEDRRAALAVDLAIPAPPRIAAALTQPWREWDHDSWSQRWNEPWDNDRLTVVTTLMVRVPLDPRQLPAPRYQRGIPCTDTAKRAVALLCRMVNTELDSVLAALDTPTRPITHPTGPT